MNKNGKSNFIFIILIPIFLIASLVVVDTVISYKENKGFKLITEKILSDVMNDDELNSDEYYSEIKRLYEYYGYDTEMLTVDGDEDNLTLSNEHRFFGLFTSLTNRNGEDTVIKILGVKFNVKKGSKTTISVEAFRNVVDEIEFQYAE